MRAVNLLPRDEAARSFEARRGVAFAGVGGIALLTVGLSALILGASGSINDKEALLDSLNAELAATPAPAAQEAPPDTTVVAARDARVAALSTALSGRVAWDGVLRQISQVLPADVWLSSLTATLPGDDPAAPSGGKAVVTIAGTTYSQSGVARYLTRLALVPVLANVTLVSSAATSSADAQTLVTFTITAEIRRAGDAS